MKNVYKRFAVAFAIFTPFFCIASKEPNLLVNPGFEMENSSPWKGVEMRGESRFDIDRTLAASGTSCAKLAGGRTSFGMWRQRVAVESGRVYSLQGQVAFENIEPPGECRLEIVFLDDHNRLLQRLPLPGHTGSRGFSLDYPSGLKTRVPDDAVAAQINLCLRGGGTAWFDDLCFSEVPVGSIEGIVTAEGNPLPEARVRLHGAIFGKEYETRTDGNGRYRLDDIPASFPRYVLMCSKENYQTRTAGDLDIADGETITANFEIVPGVDPDLLEIRFGTLAESSMTPRNTIPDGAVIPNTATGYPEEVRCFLEPDEYTQSSHPEVVAQARRILDTVPSADRSDTRAVAWALFEWMSRNIEHDSILEKGGNRREKPFSDATSGIWQTISGEGWCWGKSFLDWCYRPDELLRTRCGICVEQSLLMAAMMRTLNIPARTSSGSYEFYACAPNQTGVWIHGSATAGRTSFRETGRLGTGFEGQTPEIRYSVCGVSVIHEDWNAENKILWRERHPWGERYEATAAGEQQALKDLTAFARTGEAPRGALSKPRGRPNENPRDVRRENRPPEKTKQIHYSALTLNLCNIGTQRILDVRFPLASASDAEMPEAICKTWSNHPECVTRTWVETTDNPPAKGAERWFHIEFNLESLLEQSNEAASENEPTTILPVASETVSVVSALPQAESGANISGEPVFKTETLATVNGRLELHLDSNPVWIIEGDMTSQRGLATSDSPFGIHPATAPGGDYTYASEIGIDWERAGKYFMWVLSDPSLNGIYDWSGYDPYFHNVPAGMQIMKNITVAHDGMVKVPGRRTHQSQNHRQIPDISRHLDGTTYRPADSEAYSRWVQAAVERYDGDGTDDMPGLSNPVKYWQIDNEPPRLREGYADLVRITYSAIKKADPTTQVLLGGLELPVEERSRKNWTRTQLPILRELGGNDIDILDLHYFGKVGGWENMPDALDRVRRDLEDCGFSRSLPIWITETGTYSGSPANRRGDDKEPLQTETEQAAELLKRYTVARHLGVERIFWAWGMMEGFKHDDSFFDHTGLVYEGNGNDDPGRGVKKLSYWSYGKMTDLLQYWDGSTPQKMETAPDVYAYRFPLAADPERGIILAWKEILQ
ncbi:MAG: carboxypeptidase regulatory-like domain-containing protein [Kiritimatiellales bacterium]|nr:carboxypeptidase regulatory-like domain-containing protein [Kiritimatiellales bacterium]